MHDAIWKRKLPKAIRENARRMWSPVFLVLPLTALLSVTFMTAEAQTVRKPLFLRVASERTGNRPKDHDFTSVCDLANDPVALRVLREYGAFFVAADSVKVPPRCVFKDEEEVSEFHSGIELSTANFGGTEITLQTGAMASLLEAVQLAAAEKVKLTPLDGSIAGLRTYSDTERLWNSRFYPALDHWQRRGRIAKEAADAARELSAFEQVPLALSWESKGMWFSTGLNRSILTSVAAPGTSQHLSGLALDIVQYRDQRVRSIMNSVGWFQTVIDDEPHFTYLGLPETELSRRGLISRVKNGYKFWVPGIPASR